MSESTELTSPPPYSSTGASQELMEVYLDPDPSPQYFSTTSQALHDRLTTTRSQHLHAIVAVHVLPLVQQRAEQGLANTSIALLPVNIVQAGRNANFHSEDTQGSSLDSLPKIFEVVSGGDDDEDLEKVQLLGRIDTVRFWSQPAVLNEFRRLLKETLGTSSITVTGDKKPKPKPQPTPVQLPPQSSAKSRSFFSRRSSSKTQTTESSSPAVPKPAIPEPQAKEHVTVEIQSEEICLRTQSDFGLYETLTRPAIIVRIRILD